MRERLKRLTPKWMIKLYQGARYLGITALFFAARLFPIKKNLVVLCNVWGYGDNSKYVAKELVRRKREALKGNAGQGVRAGALVDKEQETWRAMQVVFITNHPEQVTDCPEITAFKTNSPRAVFALARAGVWVDNNRKEAYIRKRKGQYYIQLWHGGLALKRIEGDCSKMLGRSYIRRARRDSRDTDLFVSNSTFCTQMYRRAFWAQCEIAEYGSPRNDRFVWQAEKAAEDIGRRSGQISLENSGQKENFVAGTAMGKALAGQENACTVVYAPTYRTGHKSYCMLDAIRLKEAFSARFGGKWRILMRLHPLVADSDSIRDMPGVEDISHAADLYEVLYDADALITDYSNTMFEFAMTGKPVFLYADDAEEYRRERGMYFDFDSLPFPKADTAEGLYHEVIGYDAGKYKEKLDEFYQSVGLKEKGRAAALVAERIVQRC